MAKKKKAEPYDGIGKDPENKLIVQKSRPLFALWRSELTLAEFKILDMYLARINTREPEKRTVRLTKGQLEQALGVSKINKQDLAQRLKNLYQPIDLAKGDNKNIHLVGLFEEAEAELDEFGVWQISLTCTTSAMKYIFKAEELGYLRYKLRSITSLTSRYTYILFTYLEDNRFRKSWEVSLDELKEILNCEDDELYKEYKRFNERILKRCQKELHEKTECRFEYEPIKKGRKVAAIHFTLETIPDILPEPDLDGQQKLPWFDEDINDPLTFLSSACDDAFSREQMVVIFTTICLKELEHPEGIEMARFHYLQRKWALLKLHESKKRIPHRFEYFVKMLENDDC